MKRMLKMDIKAAVQNLKSEECDVLLEKLSGKYVGLDRFAPIVLKVLNSEYSEALDTIAMMTARKENILEAFRLRFTSAYFMNGSYDYQGFYDDVKVRKLVSQETEKMERSMTAMTSSTAKASLGAQTPRA